MGNFDFLEKVIASDDTLFMRSVRTLLSRTFLVRDRAQDSRMYEYVTSHDFEVRSYLGCIAYDLAIDENLGVAALVQDPDHEETVGLKRLSLRSFNGDECSVLFTLWEIYLEKVGMAEEVSVTMEELTARLDYYGVKIGIQAIRNALTLFQHFSLIDLTDMEGSGEMAVRIYPSIQFCMDIDQFREVASEYLREKEDADGEDDAEADESDEDEVDPDAEEEPDEEEEDE